MKTSRDPERPDPLLDAVLRSEQWESTEAKFKAQAMAAFETQQRVRHWTRFAASIALLAIAIAGTIYLSKPSSTVQSNLALAEPPPVAPSLAESLPSGSSRFLTDEQLLASFPEGSCFIAEIDGHKELVFLNPELERVYLFKPSSRAN